MMALLRSKALAWMAVVIWMAFIFHLSSQVAEVSNQHSTRVAKVVVKTVEKIAPDSKPDVASWNHLVRKHAHFLSYLVLGILLTHALRTSGVTGWRGIATTLMICALYAISDEIHQLFVPGRGGQVADVLIDGAGAAVGAALGSVVGRGMGRSGGAGS